MKDSVFELWLKETVKQQTHKDSLPNCHIPLYVNFMDQLRSADRYEQAKSHLDINNNSLNEILVEIEQAEERQNQNVSDFVTSSQSKIKNAIQGKDIISKICDLDKGIHKFDGSTTSGFAQPWYHLDNIYEHFHKQAKGEPNPFVIAPHEDNVFEYRSEAGPLGHGSEKGMKCLQRIIESLESDIVSSIQKLSTEAERIRNKFDSEFKRELKKVIVGIEDGNFAGQCDYEEHLAERI